MRVAVTSKGNGMHGQIAEHFGRCPEYILIDIENGRIKKTGVVPNPYFNSHTPGAVPDFMKKNHVDLVITGGIGPMGIQALNEYGIKVMTGVKGKPSDAVSDYISG